MKGYDSLPPGLLPVRHDGDRRTHRKARNAKARLPNDRKRVARLEYLLLDAMDMNMLRIFHRPSFELRLRQALGA